MRLVAVCFMVASCGSPSRTISDAPQPADGAADSPDAAPDADLRPITVTVLGVVSLGTQGMPVVGQDVYFIAPDSTYQKVATDGSGVAAAVAPAGTSVAIARDLGSSQWRLTVFGALRPGEHITAGDSAAATLTAGGAITVVAPTQANASGYAITGTCMYTYGGGPSFTYTPVANCTGSTTATIVTTAFDGTGTLAAYSAQTNLNLPALAGGTIMMPAAQTPGTASASLTNIPALVTQASLATYYQTGGWYLGNAFASTSVSGTTANMSAPIAPAGTVTEQTVRVLPSGFLPELYREVRSGLNPAVALDVGAGLLHPTTSPSFDASTRSVTWTTDPTGTAPDIVIAAVNYSTAASEIVRLQIYAPYSTTGAALPTLPPDLAHLAPDVAGGGSLNVFEQAKVTGASYADLIVMPEYDLLGLGGSHDLGEMWLTLYTPG